MSRAPQAKGVAILLDWRGVKPGDHPKRITLGEVFIPEESSLEQAEALVRAAHPAANWAQLFNAAGNWWASTSL